MVGQLELLQESEDNLKAETLPFLNGWQAWLSQDVQTQADYQPLVEGVLSSSSLREGLVGFFNSGKSMPYLNWRRGLILQSIKDLHRGGRRMLPSFKPAVCYKQ
jgi:hypothetical protein